MAGKTKLGTYQYEIDIDGKKAVLELKTLEDKTASAAKKIGGLGKSIGENFQNWIKSGLGFNALLGGVRENMMRLFRAISEGVARAAANNKEAKKSFDDFGRGIESLFTNIGSALLPILKGITDAANTVLRYAGVKPAEGTTTTTAARQASFVDPNKYTYDPKTMRGDPTQTFRVFETQKQIGLINQATFERIILEQRYLGLQRAQIDAKIEIAKQTVLDKNATADKLDWAQKELQELNRIKDVVTSIFEKQTKPTVNIVKEIPVVLEEAKKEAVKLGTTFEQLNEFTSETSANAEDAKNALNDLYTGNAILQNGISKMEVIAELQGIIADDAERQLEAQKGIAELNSDQKLSDIEKIIQAAELQKQLIESEIARGAYQQTGLNVQSGYATIEELRRQIITGLEGSIQGLKDSGADQVEILQAELKLSKTIAEFDKERLTVQEDITSEMEDQLSIFQTLIRGGLIDVENIATAARINTELTAQGITGMARFETLSSLGVKGNIGQVNIEVNEASGSTVEDAVSARLLNLFGGK